MVLLLTEMCFTECPLFISTAVYYLLLFVVAVNDIQTQQEAGRLLLQQQLSVFREEDQMRDRDGRFYATPCSGIDIFSMAS